MIVATLPTSSLAANAPSTVANTLLLTTIVKARRRPLLVSM